MEKIIALLGPVPLWAAAAVVGVVLIVIAAVAMRYLTKRRFLKALWASIQSPHRGDLRLNAVYSPAVLLRRSAVVERYAERFGYDVIALTGIDELWIERLTRNWNRRDFQRVLKYAPEKGLFQCFQAVLNRHSLAPEFKRWLDDSGEFLPLHKVAYAGRGKYFDGRTAYGLFKDKVGVMREMMGDPEWPARYFAANILVHDDEERSRKILLESITDPHPLVRKTLYAEVRSEDRKQFYAQLVKGFSSDPAYEIRQVAWDRVHREFADMYVLDSSKLDEDGVYHVMELLRPENKQDESFAMEHLDSANLEIRLPAAQYLDGTGALTRLASDVNFGDQAGLRRNLGLLEKADEVSTVGYLSLVNHTDNPASLLVCANILSKHSDLRNLTTALARKVFALDTGSKEMEELYRVTLHCVGESGTDEALELLDNELRRCGEDVGRLELLLPSLPTRGAPFFMNTLIAFLEDPAFPAPDALRVALGNMPQGIVLRRVTEIIRRPREQCPHAVKMAALRVMGEMRLEYCLQMVLENMPVLPLEEARNFMGVLSNYPKALLRDKLAKYIGSADSNIRSTIISALPVTGEKSLVKILQSSVKDPEPDVRIATIWALVEFEEAKLLDDEFGVLRDPVERVRIEAARALGEHGSDKALKKFEELLEDTDEVASVKAAAVEGLACSKLRRATDLLLGMMEQEDLAEGMLPRLIAALARKTRREEVERLLDRFKDAGARLRDSMTESFKTMGDAGAEIMLALLGEDISSLRPYITQVLEATGYVEGRIRLLAHRDPARRREAAEFLSAVGTHAAFRGIVMAARDPDQEVRVLVVKALEKLETKDGKALLEELQNDPERKIRRYTHWAMERLRAKAL